MNIARLGLCGRAARPGQPCSPTDGTTAAGPVSVTASAGDNVGVSRVECYLDGALAGSVAAAPYQLAWNSTSVSNGSVVLQARAYDAAGNSTLSSSVSVTVSASNTNSAQQNTVNQTLVLTAGQTLTLGTCGVTGASFSGDTYLRLYNSSGTQVAYNDDACGGGGSNFTYTVPAGAGAATSSARGATRAIAAAAPWPGRPSNRQRPVRALR